jgi:hypothetical protein
MSEGREKKTKSKPKKRFQFIMDSDDPLEQ